VLGAADFRRAQPKGRLIIVHRPIADSGKVLPVLVLIAAIGGSLFINGARARSAVLLSSPSSPQREVSKAQKQGPFALVLVIDAARFDQLNPARMPNLADLIAGGTEYTQAWVGQLPSVTESSHATIGTGVFPRRHQVLGDTQRVQGKNQMSPNLLNGLLDRTGYIGKFIKQSGSPSMGAIIHQRFPGSIVAAVGGHKIYAADALGAGSANFVAFGANDNHKHFRPTAIPGYVPDKSVLDTKQLDLSAYPRKPGAEDNWTTSLAENFLFKYQPRLMMVNWPEVDVAEHQSGIGAKVMDPYFSNLDNQIGRLVAAYGRAGILSQTYFVITSDHAMVPSTRTIRSRRIDQIIRKFGGRALYLGHGDYLPIYLRNPATIPRVAAALASTTIPNVDAVYAKTTSGTYALVSSTSRLADPRVNQSYNDLLGTLASPGSPDIEVLYDENTITMTPLFEKIGRKGDHGGATWGAQHIPLIIKGPNIKQDYVSNYPARLVDVAPTIETLLGARPQHQDGVPLADAMIKAPSWAAKSQASKASRMSEDVTGLEAEAVGRPNSTP
jgi:arylsulfatase A-like enzyme